MKWPYQCDKCGAVLDAGERCDCERSQGDERRQDDEAEARDKQNSDLPAMR